MKVLVINCGSSSLKYQVNDADSGRVLAKGVVDRIGEEGSTLKHWSRGTERVKAIPIDSHSEAFEVMAEALLDRTIGVLGDVSEVSAVGHRVVHGGETFVDSVLITDEVIARLEECVPLAPLHNPASLVGIREAGRILPGVPQVAVFDTAFHHTMPSKAYLYALPYRYCAAHRIRRYGFHGTSCRYVSQRAARLLARPLEEISMIICHFGNGVSMAAVAGGRSIDTSMGLTPLEGLIMGTRSGDLDPGVVFFLQRQLGMTIDGIEELLNKESGLLGISGTSNDMRNVIEQAGRDNRQCRLAVEAFTYRARKYVGAYAAALGGPDALVFTAGIGENSPLVRRMVCQGLGFMGIELDESENEKAIGTEAVVSTPGSKVTVLVVPTDEERVIVEDTLAVAGLAPRP